jgi:PAS domain S-box-containing protein
MPDQDERGQISAEEALALLEFTERAVNSRDLSELAQVALPFVVRVTGGSAAILYLEESRLPIHGFFQEGIQDEMLALIKSRCAEKFRQIPVQANHQPLWLLPGPGETAPLALFPLHRQERKLGFLGVLLPEPEKLTGQVLMERITNLLSHFINQIVDRLEYDKRNAQLKTYQAVSAKIAQTLCLREVIEAVLYSSMAAVDAEAASVLLLDAEHKNFRFFGVEGPAKPVLLNVSFPAHRGLAGYVLRTQQAAVCNDVQHDPRFYKKFDFQSGFQTKNMVAIPLVAGDEKVGVLEVLNKANGEPFNEEDRLLLQSIAEEIAFAILNADLCEAKQTLTAEVQRMHHFQTKLIQTSNDGIIASDPRGNIIIFNEGAERILGYRQDEVIGKIKVDCLYPPGLAQKVMARIKSPEHGGPGRLVQYETLGLSKTGAQIPLELSASLITEGDREVATVGFFRDLRERKHLQEKLLQSERLAALGSMAAHISHEVKNPLMVIGGLARQVLRDSTGDQQKNLEKLRVIVNEILRLEDFLVEVGGFAKLPEPKKASVDLNSLIHDMCLRLAPSLQEGGVKLELHLAAHLPPVRVDPVHLRQVILNIAKNGLEAMRRGGTLTFSSGQHHNRIFVRVTDTGEGILAESLPKIFQPFYSTKLKGSGLGLAISQRLMEANRVEIKVDSEPQKGTRVTIYLPGES